MGQHRGYSAIPGRAPGPRVVKQVLLSHWRLSPQDRRCWLANAKDGLLGDSMVACNSFATESWYRAPASMQLKPGLNTWYLRPGSHQEEDHPPGGPVEAVGSQQKVRTCRGVSHSSPTGYAVFHVGVATAGLAEGRESKNPPLWEKGKAGGHRQTCCVFRPHQRGYKTPQISRCTHSGITRAQSPSRLDIKLIKLVMKVGITPSQPTQGRWPY